MKKPVMIAFDYGQTIIDEHPVDFVRGTAEVMKYAVVNKFNKTDVYKRQTINTSWMFPPLNKKASTEIRLIQRKLGDA